MWTTARVILTLPRRTRAMSVTVPLGRSYMAPQGDTEWPGLVLSRFGNGHVTYCPGALSSAFEVFGMLQQQWLIDAVVRWILKQPHPLGVVAPQSVYVEWRKKGPDLDLIHLVNNSADMHRPIGEFIPVRDIIIELARERRRRVESLRLQRDLEFSYRDGKVVTAAPVVEHYDVVVIE